MSIQKGLGIPYQGSKRKLAPKIIDHIVKYNPNVKYLYDLFGGGGAISLHAAQHPQFEKVVYNELNTQITLLLEKILADGVTDEFYQFVSREDFFKYKDEPTWFGGFVATCWSFWSDLKSYIYGKKVEPTKRLLHEAVVDMDANALIRTGDLFGFDGSQLTKHYNIEDINDRRLVMMRDIKSLVKNRDVSQMQHLERMSHLGRIESLRSIHAGHVDKIQHLQNTNRTRLIRSILWNNGKLMINSGSYKDAPISADPMNTVIYLDPPYINTTGYKQNFDHDELYEWIERSPYKIYVSEYNSPLQPVKEMQHTTTKAAKVTKKVVEKLFCNKPSIEEVADFMQEKSPGSYEPGLLF